MPSKPAPVGSGPLGYCVRYGTNAARDVPIEFTSHSWNHGLGDVLGALLGAGLRITHYSEMDGSPHNVFPRPVKGDGGLYRIGGDEGVLPMVFGLTAIKG